MPASVWSNWYRDFIHEQHGVQTLFLNGRLCFIKDWQHTINPEDWALLYEVTALYPKDCICVLFGTAQPLPSGRLDLEMTGSELDRRMREILINVTKETCLVCCRRDGETRVWGSTVIPDYLQDTRSKRGKLNGDETDSPYEVFPVHPSDG